MSGIGPKLAITILSGMPADAMVAAIKGNNVASLTRIPGIGKKTAERMVLELRDKLDAFGVPPEVTAAASPVEEDVISALVNLGYQRPMAERALAKLGDVSGQSFRHAFPQSHGGLGKVRTRANLRHQILPEQRYTCIYATCQHAALIMRHSLQFALVSGHGIRLCALAARQKQGQSVLPQAGPDAPIWREKPD